MSFRCRLKKDDLVEVISGKDKKKRGKIIKVDRKTMTITVQGINVATLHKKPTPQDPGGIVRKELPLHVSKAMIVDPKLDKPSRVGMRIDENGEKTRYSKLSGQAV